MNKKIKIAIVGAGNAACITALHYYYYGKYSGDIFDRITIYYDPNIPIERVGQGTTIDVTKLIRSVFNINLYEENNLIKATTKDGILYENWGQKNHKIYHEFPLEHRSIHYVPNLFSKLILECGLFDIVEKNVIDTESEIDADYIFDCRGKNNRDPNLYDSLINPLNSVFLSRKEGKDVNLTYTKSVATPDGWTFVIPNHDSVSYGYLYNNSITNDEDAKNNFINLFDVVPDGHLNFQNYIAKNVWYGERTILNGNRLSFLEPLEATSLSFYQNVCKYAWEHIVNGVDKKTCNNEIRNYMNKIQSFILWHYQKGSKYDTNFWKYAKSLPFDMDKEFLQYLSFSKKHSYMDLSYYKTSDYAQWNMHSFKVWDENV